MRAEARIVRRVAKGPLHLLRLVRLCSLSAVRCATNEVGHPRSSKIFGEHSAVRRRQFMASLAAASAARLYAQSAARPSLFLDSARVAGLKVDITTTHAAMWKGVRQQADSLAGQNPPSYVNDSASNDEQLWQRDVGNAMPFLAMAHLLTADAKYLNAASRWAVASCNYPTWGKGTENGAGLATGHQLLGLSLIYDWLYSSLTSDVRDQIRRTLIARGSTMNAAALNTAYWRTTYLQNHLWVNMSGLATAGLALRGDFDASAWLNLARQKFQSTEAALGPDGASHEGSGYWSYGVEYLLKYWHLAGDAFGEATTSPWWPQTAAYRLYMSLPRAAWTSASTNVDIADCPRSEWYGPDYLLRRLAALHRDPYAQWLGGALDRAGVTANTARWLNLIWFDPSVAEQPPDQLPTMHHFEDLGLVSARSGWGGDEALLVFKCGPPLGHAAINKFNYDAGCGHVHPDANHFVLFANGEWVLRDDGYAWKETDQHNTLVIDGKGQLGEGPQWFDALSAIRPKANPQILSAASTAAVDEIIGDATAIYPPAAGLKRFVRRLLWIKPNFLIVIDNVETDSPRQLELRFHTEFPCVPGENGTLVAQGKKTNLRIYLLTPDQATMSYAETAGKDRDGKPTSNHTVRIQATRSTWQNAMLFTW